MDINKLFEYYIILFYKFNYNDYSLILESEYTLKDIYNQINNFYKENFGELLDLSKEENKEKLFDFLNDTFQFQLLEYNLNEAYKKIISSDKKNYFENNYEKLFQIVEQVYDELKDANLSTIDEQLPKLSKNNLEKLFIKFIHYIDNGNDYLEVYKYIKKNDKILYLDNLNKKERNDFIKSLNIVDDNFNDFFYKVGNKDAYIIMERTGTIQDFSKLVHEFIHYVTYYYSKDKNPNKILLEEFPSIFYEMIANKFLIENGYDNKKCLSIMTERFKYFSSMTFPVTNSDIILNIFINNGLTIDNIDIENYIRNKTYDYIEENGIDSYLKIKETNKYIGNVQIMSRKICDNVNLYLTPDPNRLNTAYPYVIGSHLAMKYLYKFTKDKNVLEEMKQITKELPNIDPNTLLEKNNEKTLKK